MKKMEKLKNEKNEFFVFFEKKKGKMRKNEKMKMERMLIRNCGGHGKVILISAERVLLARGWSPRR